MLRFLLLPMIVIVMMMTSMMVIMASEADNSVEDRITDSGPRKTRKQRAFEEIKKSMILKEYSRQGRTPISMSHECPDGASWLSLCAFLSRAG